MVDQMGQVLTSPCTVITSLAQWRYSVQGSVVLNQTTRSYYNFWGGGTGFGCGGFDGGYSDRVGDTVEGYYGGKGTTSSRDDEMRGDSRTAQPDIGRMEEQRNPIDNAPPKPSDDVNPDSSSGSVD